MTSKRSGRHKQTAAASRPDVRSADRWLGVVLAVIGCLVYANSLSGPFILDDHVAIAENTGIRSLTSVGRLLLPERELPTAGRPLVNLSFALNYAAGGLDVPGYHVVNVGIHVACALLLFGIVRRTLEGRKTNEWPAHWPARLAFGSALVWMVHPLNTEAVDYITQRTELLMALCYLLTLYAAIRAASAERPWHWSLAAIVACAAGMACKETMVTAPMVVLLYDRIFLYPSLRDAWRSRWRLYSGLAASWLVLAALLSTGPRSMSTGFSTGVTPWIYALNQTVIVTRYLFLAIWPQGLVSTYGTPLPLSLADVWPYALLLVVLAGLALIALARWPPAGFLAIVAAITLAPTSSLVPIATEVGADRRMYLPLMALATLVVCGGAFAMDAPGDRRHSDSSARERDGVLSWVRVVVFFAATSALAVRTVARNQEYRSALLLAQTTLERYPTSTAHHMLGAELGILGRHDEAVDELRLALPGAPRARYTLGVELFALGRFAEAAQELSAFVADQPLLREAVSARQILGQSLGKQGRWAEAIQQYRLVLQMNPSVEQRSGTAGLLADALFRDRRFDEANAWYADYLATTPGDAEAVTNHAVALAVTNHLDEAVRQFQRAAELQPSNGAYQRNLANALVDNGKGADAVAVANRALTIGPDDAASYEVLGRALASQQRRAEAAAAFERALQLSPGNREAQDELNQLRSARTIAPR